MTRPRTTAERTCFMVFSIRMRETHCVVISLRLGWAPATTDPDLKCRLQGVVGRQVAHIGSSLAAILPNLQPNASAALLRPPAGSQMHCMSMCLLSPSAQTVVATAAEKYE